MGVASALRVKVNTVSDIDFNDRVAIVTGAGGGLGRAHALLLAERGARVVVNDLGGARDGSGAGASMADAVVAEIKAAGGDAVANYDGVHTWEGGEAIVQTALDTYGRVDIVVNNAGILRDTSFTNLAQDALDAVLKVHLYGAFHVTHAAWSVMREQAYGRVVMTTSGSGLYGNFGQANYAAAKLGLVGLTRTLAIEGAKYNIAVNAIAPAATSRMTEDVFPEALLDKFDPAFVSPLVALLASEASHASGNIYSVGGGHYARVALLEGAGASFDHVPSLEELQQAFTAVDAVTSDSLEIRNGVFEQTEKIARALKLMP